MMFLRKAGPMPTRAGRWKSSWCIWNQCRGRQVCIGLRVSGGMRHRLSQSEVPCGPLLHVAPCSRRSHWLDAASPVRPDRKARSGPRGRPVRWGRPVRPGRKAPRVRKGRSGRKGPRVHAARPVRRVRRAQSGRKVRRVTPDRKVRSGPPASAASRVRRARRVHPAQPDRPARQPSLLRPRRFASSAGLRRLPATTPNNWCRWSARAARPMAPSAPPAPPPPACACGPGISDQ